MASNVMEEPEQQQMDRMFWTSPPSEEKTFNEKKNKNSNFGT